MTRAHDACRRDLMNARHRVSKMLLRHGRVYPKSTTWTAEHRRWLSGQQFSEPASDWVFADLLAAVDGLSARKQAIALRLSELASDERWWPTVARLRAFRGVDTLTAFSIHLELGADWQRRVLPPGPDHQDRLDPRPPATGRIGLALQPPAAPGRDAGQPPGRPARPRARDRQPRAATTAQAQPHDARPRQAAQRHRRRLRPRAVLLPLGRRHRRLTPGHSLTGREAGAPGHPRPARATQL